MQKDIFSNSCFKVIASIVLVFLGIFGWVILAIYLFNEKEKRKLKKDLSFKEAIEIIGFKDCLKKMIGEKQFNNLNEILKNLKRNNGNIEKKEENSSYFENKEDNIIVNNKIQYEEKKNNNIFINTEKQEYGKSFKEKNGIKNEKKQDSISSKSIWDDYESVLDTMKKNK